jgi:C4-dicarboxylate transporter DctM subunit
VRQIEGIQRPHKRRGRRVPMGNVAIGIAVFLFLGLTGLPIFLSFCAGAAVAAVLLGMTFHFIPSVTIEGIYLEPLLAIPCFIIAGELMLEGGISDALVNFVRVLAGKSKAGLGHATVLACAAFGAVTGSAVATTAAIGSVMVPKLTQYGYDKKYSTALIASASYIGILIPPSIPLIIYAVVAGQSISRLFLASVGSGILMTGCYLIVNYFMSNRWVQPFAGENQESGRDKGVVGEKQTGWISAGVNMLPALALPVVILGGIFSGIFTATEASGFAAVGAAVLGFGVYRGLKLDNTRNALLRGAITAGVILILLGFARTIVRIFVLQGLPEWIAETTTAIASTKFVVLLLISIIFLLLGFFVDGNTNIIIMTPLLMPLAQKMGIDPIHLGVVMNLGVGIGLITPPMCPTLFVAVRLSDLRMDEVMRALLPFFFSALPVYALITFVPEVSLWLPRLIMG